MSTAWLEATIGDDGSTLKGGGAWIVEHAGVLDRQLNAAVRRLAAKPPSIVLFDLGDLAELDTTGAWLLHRTRLQLDAQGARTDFQSLSPDAVALLDLVSSNNPPKEMVRPEWNPLIRVFRRTGVASIELVREIVVGLGFIGEIFAGAGQILIRPWRFRLTATVLHMERVGINALPIICLVSFLIGVVLAYQGVDQLRRFGAEIFVVNMVAVSVLREIGILLTSIVVAGRSGSAFTAEIGTMIVNEEVDAMRTIGLDPIEVLVLPRIVALIIMLPILAFISDLMGLLGGMLMCWGALDITPRLYLDQMRDAIGLWTFWIGIIKAPVFAGLIAIIGCYHGLRVSKSAASVGIRTTTSVVYGIFSIIVADAAFSILFSMFGV